MEYLGEVPAEAILSVDPNVMSKLPQDSRIERIIPHGKSLWTRTARIDTVLETHPTAFFLKLAANDRGKDMLLGEFTAMTYIYNAAPDLCPRPIAWGTYDANPDVHFLLCQFHRMAGHPPANLPFVKKIAEFHLKATSPDGKFGFPVTTYHGQTPLDHGWTDTWEEYFVTRTKPLMLLEEAAQGPSKELDSLSEAFFTKVAPRLLRPLENGGRSIAPRLIHGDCWDGNTATDEETGQPIIFDAASFYAHSEYELAVWSAPWNKIDKSCIQIYANIVGVSAPEEDFEDRIALYATRVNILDSILYKDTKEYREAAIKEMRRLVEKYKGGFEAWEGQEP